MWPDLTTSSNPAPRWRLSSVSGAMSPAPASVSGGTQMDDDADGPMAVLLVEDNDGDAELSLIHI